MEAGPLRPACSAPATCLPWTRPPACPSIDLAGPKRPCYWCANSTGQPVRILQQNRRESKVPSKWRLTTTVSHSFPLLRSISTCIFKFILQRRANPLLQVSLSFTRSLRPLHLFFPRGRPSWRSEPPSCGSGPRRRTRTWRGSWTLEEKPSTL